ncbi:MAG: antibiotic biosynthesis monooxygenase [Chloroflexi bacterium]|nr:antibiotic biosynthesis monooxygenase [Chloroflexota bacterium]
MYGTVARLRLKPGSESKLIEHLRQYETSQTPGAVSAQLYRLDATPSECLLAVTFSSKEAYAANASSPEQEARYRQMMELLEGEPVWQDGEIVYQGSMG